jgi:hypothetical protein
MIKFIKRVSFINWIAMRRIGEIDTNDNLQTERYEININK